MRIHTNCEYNQLNGISIVNNNDAKMKVHGFQVSEVAQLRWDGATELTRLEDPEKAMGYK